MTFIDPSPRMTLGVLVESNGLENCSTSYASQHVHLTSGLRTLCANNNINEACHIQQELRLMTCHIFSHLTKTVHNSCHASPHPHILPLLSRTKNSGWTFLLRGNVIKAIKIWLVRCIYSDNKNNCLGKLHMIFSCKNCQKRSFRCKMQAWNFCLKIMQEGNPFTGF